MLIKGLLSPARRVPPKILLSKIFLACLPSGYNVFSKTFDAKYPRSFSDISVVTGELLPCDLMQVPNQMHCVGTAVCMLETWPQRSAKCPLFIRLVDVPFASTLSSLTGCRILYLLTFARLHGSNQRLPALLAKAFHSNQPHADPGIFNAFEIAPQMDDVVIKRAVNLPHSLRLPWSQLTQYNGPIGTDIVEVLRGLPNIVSCRLECHGAVDDHLPSGAVRLPHLRSLYLDSSYGGELLDSLTLLALEEISIREYENGRDLGCLLDLLRRSSCFLKKLDLPGLSKTSAIPAYKFQRTCCFQNLNCYCYPNSKDTSHERIRSAYVTRVEKTEGIWKGSTPNEGLKQLRGVMVSDGGWSNCKGVLTTLSCMPSFRWG